MSTKKGDYYRRRTKRWLEAQGFVVANLERNLTIRVGRRRMHRRFDIWGADLLAMRQRSTPPALVFVNSVLGRDHIAAHIRRFQEWPYPSCDGWVQCWIAVWKVRGRRPDIVVVPHGQDVRG